MKNNEKFMYTKELMKMFEDSTLSNFEYEDGDFRIAFSKGSEVHHVQPVVSAPISVGNVNENVVAEEVDNCKEVVVSPIVGTFYSSSSPTADAYVSVGDKVKKGQVLCIVEAMKVMNEISSPCDGEIVEILVSDSEGVEFDQPLFKIK